MIMKKITTKDALQLIMNKNIRSWKLRKTRIFGGEKGRIRHELILEYYPGGIFCNVIIGKKVFEELKPDSVTIEDLTADPSDK